MSKRPLTLDHFFRPPPPPPPPSTKQAQAAVPSTSSTEDTKQKQKDQADVPSTSSTEDTKQKQKDSNNDSSSFSRHATYPFPIAHLPSKLREVMNSAPAAEGRVIDDQPELDLVLFKPFVPREAQSGVFKFLRAELPFYVSGWVGAGGGGSDGSWTTTYPTTMLTSRALRRE
jgi:hypothetical protein